MPKKKTKNQQYWEKRALELEAIKNKKVEKQLSELETINAEISRRMKRQINYWVSRFAKDNGLTYAAAQQKLTPAEIEEYRLDLQTYIKYASQLDDQVPEEWLLMVRNASTTYHLTRLEALKIALINEVNDFIYKENNAIFEFLEELYKDTYYRQTYEIAKGVDATVNLFHPNEYKVKLLIKKPWTDDGIEFSERLWGPHREKIVEELHKALEESLRKGDNATKMAEDIAEKFEVRKDHAEALLHTESARIDEEARYENLKDLEVEKYIIVATLDHKTSSICRKVDGKVFELSKKEVGVNYPPFHVRCRTTVAPYIDEEYGLGQRAARDKNGKTIYVPENMTYPEFHRKYIAGDKEYSNVEKAWKNRFSDKKQHEKYKNAGVEVPKSFEDYQKMKYNKSTDRDIKLRSVDYARRNKLKNNPKLRLPNVETATIDKNKFEKYLFGGDNEKGLTKGRLIEEKLGYNINNYKYFEKEILLRSRDYPATFKGENQHGKRYEQQIIFYNKNKEPVNLLVAWLENNGKTHMTTAYITEVK
ncbi:minor capsid protein [Peptostreptococcus equinus]|uniref:Minor capsid protein n=1 Tax=Peptostreptococcus equinus TaxID=3003601 RepID=A0ABY7JQ19_9FIRM|nr:minor capsid protein [Peptostreptococcus sp. CBA3647]WAW15445.1 minor capsid protein [Peptostreptococcus sp. CBA3647]